MFVCPPQSTPVCPGTGDMMSVSRGIYRPGPDDILMRLNAREDVVVERCEMQKIVFEERLQTLSLRRY